MRWKLLSSQLALLHWTRYHVLKEDEMQPQIVTRNRTVQRKLHDPIRSVDEAFSEISLNLWAELSASQPSPLRRAEIFQRLELVIRVIGQMTTNAHSTDSRGK